MSYDVFNYIVLYLNFQLGLSQNISTIFCKTYTKKTLLFEITPFNKKIPSELQNLSTLQFTWDF